MSSTPLIWARGLRAVALLVVLLWAPPLVPRAGWIAVSLDDLSMTPREWAGALALGTSALLLAAAWGLKRPGGRHP
ncbi:hypothetical protein [Deinococcus navajonensis]|uniref:MYXO-CTERM domain-containing protein n=1 Tax=Deinococcus navajonensis TaxID=309884 RepID=A0ABV8XKG6_9DEIO